MKAAKWALKLVIFGFTTSFNSGWFLFSGLSLSRCRNLASETIRYVHELLSGRFASICFVHNPIFCRLQYTILFPLNFKHFFTISDLVNWNLWKKKLEYHLINYRFKYFRQIWSRFSGKVDLPAHFAVNSTLQNMLEWNWHISFTSS